jgi:hypothetical protein
VSQLGPSDGEYIRWCMNWGHEAARGAIGGS